MTLNYQQRRPFPRPSCYPKKEYIQPNYAMDARQKNTMRKMHKILKSAVNDARDFLIDGEQASLNFFRFVEDLACFVGWYLEFSKRFRLREQDVGKAAKKIKRAKSRLDKFKRLEKNGVDIESVIFEKLLKPFKRVYFVAQCLAVDFDDFVIAQSFKERGQGSDLEAFEEIGFMRFDNEFFHCLKSIADYLSEFADAFVSLNDQSAAKMSAA